MIRFGNKHKCIDCIFCDAEKMLCHPQSKDCKPEYKLSNIDLDTPEYCSFFKAKEAQHGRVD